MGERQQKLLRVICEEYIKTAMPVSSTLISDKYFPELSSATIRNEMSELEKGGLIKQPHTSAGRVPTPEGLKQYVDFLVGRGVSQEDSNSLDELPEANGRDELKQMARCLAELSRDAVVIGFGPRDVYYTGIGNLFAQPEFNDNDLVRSVSQVFDEMEEAMFDLLPAVTRTSTVMLGEENPFGQDCGTIAAKINIDGNDVTVAFLGPMRMDYSRNLGLLEYLKQRYHSEDESDEEIT